MRVRVAPFGFVCGIATLWSALWLGGCGDDSLPLQQQWPNFTGGAPATSTATSTASGAVPTDTTSAQAPTNTSSATATVSPGATSSSSATSTSTLPPSACSPDRFRCVEAVPPSWEGPIARKQKGTGASVPSCDGEYRVEINDTPYRATPQFGPATCSMCSCRSPELASIPCTTVSDITYFSDSMCVTELVGDAVAQDGSCNDVSNAVGDADSVRIPGTQPDLTNIGCQAIGGDPTLPAGTWAQQERLCRSAGPTNLTCADPSQLCVPKADTSFAAGLCIHRDGDHACPAGAFSNKVLLFKGEQDSRGCQACACGAITGNLQCTGHLVQYSKTMCTDTADTIIEALAIGANGATICQQVQAFPSTTEGVPKSLELDVEVEGQASCPSSGGGPTGAMTGVDPITLCCTAQ